ncbi:hypothetical protein [Agarilytica rhodophyticola]|uniref:hypothetical protein n=1 Tax=Agarilytica rhodophyticola TaxID=1737490 RepID=UPI0013159361|nr:hypothetical protein [Agarilytica rhodophyticola]
MPGLDGTGKLFNEFLNYAVDVEVIAISYPYNKILSFSQYIKFIESRLPKDSEIFLLAESFSGPLAVNILLNKQINISRVIFCASFSVSPFIYLLKALNYYRNILPNPHNIPDSLIKLFCVNGAEHLVKEVKQAIRCVDPKVLLSRVALLSKFEKKKIFIDSDISHVKACYLMGKKDRLVSRKYALKLSKFFSDFDIYEINGPHFLLQSNPYECWKSIESFISDN